jgi:ribosomal protein S18 acetylase RimI-like enzyme
MLADYAVEIATHQTWVAELESRIAGVLVLIPKDTYLLLDNIAVHPRAQGRGIGRILLELADREALRQGFNELRLYTHLKMTENIDLYRRIGWQETGRGEQDGYERVFFRRRLDPGRARGEVTGGRWQVTEEFVAEWSIMRSERCRGKRPK